MKGKEHLTLSFNNESIVANIKLCMAWYRLIVRSVSTPCHKKRRIRVRIVDRESVWQRLWFYLPLNSSERSYINLSLPQAFRCIVVTGEYVVILVT